MFEILTYTAALLKTFTPRTERHCEDDVSAASLGLKITGANTMLDVLQPGLRDMLYKAVESQEHLPGIEPSTPLLRSKGVESVKLTCAFDGWTLKIDAGLSGEDDPIAIGGSKVDAFVVVPSEGGTVDLHFRVGSSDIDESEAGWLFGHLKQQISITLHAPKTPPDAIDGSTEAFRADHPDATDLFAGGPDEDPEDPDSEGDQSDAEPEAEPPRPARRGRKTAASVE